MYVVEFILCDLRKGERKYSDFNGSLMVLDHKLPVRKIAERLVMLYGIMGVSGEKYGRNFNNCFKIGSYTEMGG